MTQHFFNGGLAVFVTLTLGLAVNLMGRQEGTRELAPAPVIALKAPAKKSPTKRDATGLVILNAEKTNQTAQKVQRELTAQGYVPGPADGTPSPVTRAAIMAFEYDNGLPLKALANDVLLERLLGLRPPVAGNNKNAGLPASPEAKRVMQTIQQSLKQLRYEPGKVDGAYSAETERAIRDFETDNNLPETGRVSGRLISALANLADRGKLKVSSK